MLRYVADVVDQALSIPVRGEDLNNCLEPRKRAAPRLLPRRSKYGRINGNIQLHCIDLQRRGSWIFLRSTHEAMGKFHATHFTIVADILHDDYGLAVY